MKIFFYTTYAFLLFCFPVHAAEKFLDIKEVTSTNGIKAWLVEDHSLPIISLQFSFKEAGSIQDGATKQGLAQLLSNTMDEGAGDLPSQEFQKILTDNSISLYFNSSRDNFGGQLKTLSRNKDKAFELLSLALTSPRFDEEPLARMRDANMSRIRSSMGNPDWINARVFNDLAFAGHPYALNSGGTLTSLGTLTAQDLKDFKNNWLTKDKLYVGVTGDITAEQLKTVLDKVFNALPAQGKKNEVQKLELQNTGKTYLFKRDIPQTIISSALPSIDINDPDYDALRVMNYIYGGGGFGSYVMDVAREKRGLTYGIYSSLQSQDYINLLDISTSTKNNSTTEIIQIITDEMNRLKNQTVAQEDLDSAKSYLIGSMPLSLGSTDKISSILLGLQMDNRPIDYLDGYAERIKNITPQDIQKAATRVLNPDKLLTVMVGNPQENKLYTNIESLPNVE